MSSMNHIFPRKSAQRCPAPLDPQVAPTIQELRARIAYWQRELRLDHWDVKAHFARTRDMDDFRVGAITYDLAHHEAEIQFEDPRDHETAVFRYDFEGTVIHELMHLHLAPLATPPGTVQDSYEELVINRVAEALAAQVRARYTAEQKLAGLTAQRGLDL